MSGQVPVPPTAWFSVIVLLLIDALRQQQGASLAYFDVFWVAAVVGVALVVLVLFMKRSVAEKGAHVGAE
jgi:DHA2 family multidrug resistance protein